MTDGKANFDEVLEDLKTLRDELKVKAHLAGKDLQDFLDKVDGRVEDAQARFEGAVEAFRAHEGDIRTAFEGLLGEVKAGWKAARDRLG